MMILGGSGILEDERRESSSAKLGIETGLKSIMTRPRLLGDAQ